MTYEQALAEFNCSPRILLIGITHTGKEYEVKRLICNSKEEVYGGIVGMESFKLFHVKQSEMKEAHIIAQAIKFNQTKNSNE